MPCLPFHRELLPDRPSAKRANGDDDDEDGSLWERLLVKVGHEEDISSLIPKQTFENSFSIASEANRRRKATAGEGVAAQQL